MWSLSVVVSHPNESGLPPFPPPVTLSSAVFLAKVLLIKSEPFHYHNYYMTPYPDPTRKSTTVTNMNRELYYLSLMNVYYLITNNVIVYKVK